MPKSTYLTLEENSLVKKVNLINTTLFESGKEPKFTFYSELFESTIHNPFSDPSGRFQVSDPIQYYGDDFLSWARSLNRNDIDDFLRSDIIGKSFNMFSIYDDYNSWKSFTNMPSMASIYGYKESDFIPVKVSIVDIIDFSKNTDKYNDVTCGFFGEELRELSPSFIFQSLVLTKVCFPDSPKVASKNGSFVELKVERV